MAHVLVRTNMTRLNVETVSASVKQQHYDSMFASMEQSKIIDTLETYHEPEP